MSDRHFHRPAMELEGSRRYHCGVLVAKYVCECGQELPERRVRE